MNKITIFWYRRDLRLDDNAGLYYACQNETNVLPLFIFDQNILEELEDFQDARVQFINQQISRLHEELEKMGSTMLVKLGKPINIFQELVEKHAIHAVYTNRDYEPYAIKRDKEIGDFLKEKAIPFLDFKDQVIFEKDEITTEQGTFYKVYTPYRKAWMKKFNEATVQTYKVNHQHLLKTNPSPLPTLKEIGFEEANIPFPPLKINKVLIQKYDKHRDLPEMDATTHLGIHLRFGTISVRKLALQAKKLNETFLGELIWRDFFMMTLYNSPQVVDHSFKAQYDQVPWRNDPEEFQKWCEGKTGYPIVDAGMRELNQTGYMHNRVRMIVASFLTKHLLIDWRWGEAYFAKKLLDYELASNNGNWQWAAGTGTDAQPYFRVFNPDAQARKFDKDNKYIKKWVEEWGTNKYPPPMVNHKMARDRALKTYKSALKQ